MIINKKSLRDGKRWIYLALIALVACQVWYSIYYTIKRVTVPRGGSVPGLWFGVIGTAFILFAFAITVRRKFRASRAWGTGYNWLQGHVYLSIASYWIIMMHAGWSFGGQLTSVLMWTFTACYVSGLIVLLMQQMIPRLLLAEVTRETIYDQIDAVARRNLAAADALVKANAVVEVMVPDLDQDAMDADVGQARREAAPGVALKAFYDKRVRPFLAHGISPADQGAVAGWFAGVGRVLRSGPAAPGRQDFDDIRRKTPDELNPAIDALEGYAEERRHFALQKRLHHWLHGWLLIHVPTAWVMTALLIVHAVYASSFLDKRVFLRLFGIPA